MSTEIATRGTSGLAVRYEWDVEDLIAQVKKIQALMAQVMKDGEHYGVIPGTAKPSLLKPGAEKLAVMFRLAPEYDSAETLDGRHLTVKTTCTLVHIPTGQKWGSGQGSCSTKESKYAYRRSARVCPRCETENIRKGKEGGWFCWRKLGGCGATFLDGDASVEGQAVGRVANEDVADQWNTVLKMSNKRALVAAVLNVTAASDIFTQDAEDTQEAPRAAGRVIDVATGEVLDAPSPEPAVDAADRMKLVDEITRYHEALGTPQAKVTVTWARAIGPNVKEEDAPIEKLLALRDALATQAKL